MQKTKEETKENEIKVAGNGQVPKYLSYALRILKHSDKYNSITIRASGNAIVKAMQIVELIKRKIGNLHQINKIQTMMIVDTFEPTVEGLKVQEQQRRVTAFDCILSKEPLDTSDPGYQPPKPPEEPTQSKPQVQKKNAGNQGKKQYNNNEPKDKRESKQDEKHETQSKPRGGNRGAGHRGGRQKRYNDDSDVKPSVTKRKDLDID